MSIKYPRKECEGFIARDGAWHNHAQCPGCGHNFFQGGSGFCRWCVKDMKDSGKKMLFEEDTKIVTCIKPVK